MVTGGTGSTGRGCSLEITVSRAAAISAASRSIRLARFARMCKISASGFLFSFMALTLLPCAALSIPTEAAAMALFERGTLEPLPTGRTHAIDQARDLSPGEPHLTRPTSTRPVNRLKQPGSDPGADPPGRQAETLDNLLKRDQDVIGSRVHGDHTLLRRGESQALFVRQRRIIYVMSHSLYALKAVFIWH